MPCLQRAFLTLYCCLLLCLAFCVLRHLIYLFGCSFTFTSCLLMNFSHTPHSYFFIRLFLHFHFMPLTFLSHLHFIWVPPFELVPPEPPGGVIGKRKPALHLKKYEKK
eukprot:Hpha_TRINITY_DN15819_c6_g2::TRINITY_DN15819_c6_g2_i5::g.187078::m.187078